MLQDPALLVRVTIRPKAQFLFDPLNPAMHLHQKRSSPGIRLSRNTLGRTKKQTSCGGWNGPPALANVGHVTNCRRNANPWECLTEKWFW
jgi:hypothetical protein